MLTFKDLLRTELNKKDFSSNELELEQLKKCFDKSPSRIRLIRHNLNDPACRECYNKGNEWWDIYQQTQKKNCFDKTDFIFAFVSNGGTSARYIGCWKVCGKIEKEATKNVQLPTGFKYTRFLDNEHYFYKLEEITFIEESKKRSFLEEYKHRLIINWGLGTRAYVQKLDNIKEIIAIDRPKEFFFDGYESVIRDFIDLKKIKEEPENYQDWIEHLSAVNAVYLIVDMKTGAQYVGSAYGKDGLWGRWKHYVEGNGHLSDNIGIKKYLDEIDSNGKKIHSIENFQFSILRITPKYINQQEALDLEKLYKQKLNSRSEHSLNEN